MVRSEIEFFEGRAAPRAERGKKNLVTGAHLNVSDVFFQAVNGSNSCS